MTQSGFSRRRFLRIAAAVPLTGLGTRAMATAPVAHWQGVALGARSQIVLSGLDGAGAAHLFAMVQDEIARLEDIFSLYRSQSSLSRLNQTGSLANPAMDLLQVLSLSRAVWTASGGAFDPSIQPVWAARHAGAATAATSRTLSDVAFTAQQVTLNPGMALTLNGIAQGYITDRIADLLRGQGLTDLVVDAGEQRALGQRPGGGDWRVGIADPAGKLVTQMSLRDRALATSSPAGTRLADGQGHIIDGRTGRSARTWNTISIAHDSAAIADALSTAACCLNSDEITEMLRAFDGAELVWRG